MAREVNHSWEPVFSSLDHEKEVERAAAKLAQAQIELEIARRAVPRDWHVCTVCGVVQNGTDNNQDCPGYRNLPEGVFGVPV